MPTEVRSYALALWLFSKGHIPLDVGFTPAGTLVFTFSPSAAVDVNEFHDAKRVFVGLEARARALRAARQRAEVRS
jgi:hypothetical protein